MKIHLPGVLTGQKRNNEKQQGYFLEIDWQVRWMIVNLESRVYKKVKEYYTE